MELTQEMIVGAAVAMGGAIVWLARNQVVSQRRCEKEGDHCRSKQAELDRFIRTELLSHTAAAASRESETTSELARSRRLLDRLERLLPAAADSDETPTQPARTHG